jgi:hypothetical protein
MRLGDMHYRPRRAIEIGCVQNHQIGRLADHVDDIAHQPTVIFEHRACFRHKDKFPRNAARAEIMNLYAACLQIMFEQL